MRTHTFLLGLLLGSALAPLTGRELEPTQEPAQEKSDEQPQELKKSPPLTALREAERERLETELQGAWDLMNLYSPLGFPDSNSYRGFMIFADGICSVHYHAEVEGTGVLGLGVDDFLQSEIYRYRIDDLGMLQMASIMGFNTLNDYFELQFVGNRIAEEYSVNLVDGQLELSTFDGRRLTYRQIQSGDFPLNAIDKLQRTQGGRFEDPDDRANRARDLLGRRR